MNKSRGGMKIEAKTPDNKKNKNKQKKAPVVPSANQYALKIQKTEANRLRRIERDKKAKEEAKAKKEHKERKAECTISVYDGNKPEDASGAVTNLPSLKWPKLPDEYAKTLVERWIKQQQRSRPQR